MMWTNDMKAQVKPINAVNFRLSALLPLVLLAVLVAGGCSLAGSAVPEPFETPAENWLILQVPYYSEGTGSYSQAALAALMTYYGRPRDMAEIGNDFGQRAIPPRRLVSYARKAGLKAEYSKATPEELVRALRRNQPVIVLMGADAPPLKSGSYAVVVGYTQNGVVVNSTDVHQQIVDWAGFLTAWFEGSNSAVIIEPL